MSEPQEPRKVHMDDPDPELPHQDEIRFCPACGHKHQSEAFGWICIGCPCQKQPPFRKLAL